MVLKIRCILLNFANYLLYYTCKKVTYEYNCWRREDESVLYFLKRRILQAQEREEVRLIMLEDLYK